MYIKTTQFHAALETLPILLAICPSAEVTAWVLLGLFLLLLQMDLKDRTSAFLGCQIKWAFLTSLQNCELIVARSNSIWGLWEFRRKPVIESL